MSTTDFSATSRHHLTSKEDLISVNHRSFDIDAKFRDFCGVLGLDPSEAGGKYHGEWGFRAYTNARGVLYHGTRIDPELRYPPYSSQKKGHELVAS